MNKQEYMNQLKDRLKHLPKEDFERAIEYYEEYFADAGPENEQKAIEDLGSPQEAVDFRKQRKICRVADYYRYVHGLGDGTGVRYDVVGIQGSEIQWIQNAFPHIYALGY